MAKAADADRINSLVDEATERGNLRRQVADLKSTTRALEDELAKTRKTLDLTEAVAGAKPSPPRWTRTKGKGKHPAIPFFLLTDTHLDEVVRPEEIMGLNAFDRQIGYGRLERAFKGAARVVRDYVAGHTYEGLVLALGGDMFSGEIHDEHRETNEETIVESLVYWLEPMLAGVNLLAEEFGKVHIVGVVGNHTRRTRKPRAKLRAKDNYDWLLYQLLGREVRSDPRVTIQVPSSADVLVPVFDTRILLTHGDQFRGGSGIAGALSPLMIGEHRKLKRNAAASRWGSEDVTYDLMVMGHWHQRMILHRLIVGGTLKGYDEYAFVNNLEYQPPSQELLVIAPERGPILNVPVWVQDRQAEGW